MDGVSAARSVMLADAALMALVPDYTPTGETVPRSRIVAGPLSVNAPLPAISLESISKVDLNIPAPGTQRFVTERVQVTVLAANYSSQKTILRAVRKALADKLYPSVNGITGVTIHTDSAGPDMMNEAATIHFGSQDFRIKYLETR